MALVINTNVMSLNAQRQLGKSQSSLNTSMERLSSGLRINSAKDDAAGLAISDRMTSQIRGLNQAARNANDGISLAQTAEGALQESTNILQRIRELAVQSANDTNSDSDRSSLNDEVTQLKAELDRIAETTEFNGRKVIDGSLDDATFQVGANAGTPQTISFNIQSALAADLSDVGTVIEPSGEPVIGANVSGGSGLAAGDIVVNGKAIEATASGSAIDIAAALNTAAGENIATAQNVQTINFTNVALNEDNSNAALTAVNTVDGVASSITTAANSAVQTMDMSATTVGAGDTLEFTVAGETFNYTNSGATNLSGADLVADIESKFGTRDVGGTAGEYTFAQDGSTDTQLNISQAAGNESEIAVAFKTTNNTVVSAPTATISTAFSATVDKAVAEEQALDLSTTTVEDGATLKLTIDGEVFAYSNETGAAVSGSALVTAIATKLNGTEVGGSGIYNFAADAGTTTQLNITQAVGNESDIDPITTANDSAISNPAATTVNIVDGAVNAGDSVQLDLSSVTVAQGDSLKIEITTAAGTETITYTNDNAGADLSGANLVADIQQDLLGNPEYTVTQNGGTDTQLDLVQQEGYFGEITSITANITSAGTVNQGLEVVADGGLTETTAAVPGTTGEVSKVDISGLDDLAANEVLTITIDGEDFTYSIAAGSTMTAAVTDMAAGNNTSSGNATFTHSDGRVFTMGDLGAGVLTISEADGVDAAGFTASISRSDLASTATVAGSGDAGVQEFQSIDFSETTVGAGESLTFTIDGVDVTYTNDGATNLSGSNLVADIASDLNNTVLAAGTTSGVFGVDYTFKQNATEGDRLDIQQTNIKTVDIAQITTKNNTTTASAPTATTETEGVAGSAAGSAAVAQVQALDLSETTVEAGETLTFKIAGESIVYTNSGADALSGADLAADIETRFGTRDVGGVAGEYTFAQDGGTTSQLNITQAVGNESSIAQITTVNSSSVDSPTATIVEAGTAQVLGAAAVSEKQSFNFSGRSVADGRTVDFKIGSETLTYTNNSGATLTGADLVADIENQLGTTDVGNGLGDYSFAQAAGTNTQLDISQATGNESDIGAISVTTQGTVTGTYSLQLNGNTLDLSEVTADAAVTATEVAGAINSVSGFTAAVGDDGSISITSDNASSFTLQEFVDTNGTPPYEDTSGLEGITSAAATTFEGQVAINSDSDVVLTGSAGLVAAGLNGVGNVTTTIDNVDISTRESAWIAIESVDAALSDIDEIRGGLGAVQNRFTSTINNLNNVAENLSAARSRILDADIAMESSNMTKQNILQQAGVSILAQANQAPQLALSLIG